MLFKKHSIYGINQNHADMVHILEGYLRIEKSYTFQLCYRPNLDKQIRADKFIDPKWKELSYMYVRYGQYALLEANDALITIDYSIDGSKITELTVSTSSKELVTKYKKLCEEAIVPIDLEEKIQMNFWYDSKHGPQNKSCSLEVPNWDEIKANYNAAIQTELERLTLINPNKDNSTHGKLILLQGEPGTGKTFYIRALAKAWHKWCNFHYIVDVDHFFDATGASYMFKVLSAFETDDDEDYPTGLPATIAPSEKYNLLVLEDSGELIGKSARAESGQNLSRLLNVTDGLMGQGLKLFILITTNEELKDLNDAVSRPGRCLASVSFKPFTAAEADTWLVTQGLDPIGEPASLAKLFSLRDKSNLVISNKKINKSIGFFKD